MLRPLLNSQLLALASLVVAGTAQAAPLPASLNCPDSRGGPPATVDVVVENQTAKSATLLVSLKNGAYPNGLVGRFTIGSGPAGWGGQGQLGPISSSINLEPNTVGGWGIEIVTGGHREIEWGYGLMLGCDAKN